MFNLAQFAYDRDHFFARACVTDTPILIKGIAAAMKISECTWTTISFTVDTTMEGRLSEQFKLLDSNYRLLAEQNLDSVVPSYRMEFRKWYTRDTFDIYEVFFDKPVLVNGMFFVGGTTHNNLMYGYYPDHGWACWAHLHTLYPFFFFNQEFSEFDPKPPILLHKFEWPYNTMFPHNPEGNFDNEPALDTSTYEIYPNDKFLPFFAIIDTDYVYSYCEQPTGLFVDNATTDSVTISWNGGTEPLWDVLVWTNSTEPDSGITLCTQTNSLTLHGLDINQDYNIKVMAVCDTFHANVSSWSEVLHFRISDHIVQPCPSPTGLYVQTTNLDGGAYATWNHQDVDYHELSLCADGEDENNATILRSQMDYMEVTGLDTASWYTAKLRAVCDSNDVSLWGDSVRFYVPNYQYGEGIDNPADRLTQIMPNPTSDKVTVLSACQIQKIELFDNTGKKISVSDFDGLLSIEVDLSTYPSGIYVIHIITDNGTSTKQLVKK